MALVKASNYQVKPRRAKPISIGSVNKATKNLLQTEGQRLMLWDSDG